MDATCLQGVRAQVPGLTTKREGTKASLAHKPTVVSARTGAGPDGLHDKTLVAPTQNR